MILRASSNLSSLTRLNQLHWLPVECRIRFKLVSLIKPLQTSIPGYFQPLASP